MSDRETTPSRRRYLQALAGSGIATGLAGCNQTPTTTDTTDDSSTTVVFTDTTTTTPPTTAGTEPQTDVPAEYVFDAGSLRAFVDAVETANEVGGTVTVTPGTYQFEPLPSAAGGGTQPHAAFQALNDVTIDGNGATFVFTAPLHGGFDFVGGTNLTIRNLTLDYDPVPFTQGVITDFSQTDRTITLALDAGYPTFDHQMFERADTVYATTHDTDGQFIHGIRASGSADKEFTAITHLDDRTYRLTLEDYSSLRGIEPNNRLTVVARNNQAALRFYKLSNPSLQNVTIRASNGGAFAAQVCATPTFQDCTITPPPDTDRQLSTVADGVRITNCLDSARVEGCRHERLGDDSVAVDYRLAELTAFRSDTEIRVDGVHPFVVQAGDVLEGLSPSGIRRGELPPVDDIVPRFSGVGDRQKPASITFEQPVRDQLSVGDFIGNTETASQHYTIRDNEFRAHRANLIRASTGPGRIERNTLDGADANAIELHTGTLGYWPPKGGIRDVTVRENTIRRAGLTYFAGEQPSGIAVHHEAPPGYSTKGRPNQNVTIADNTIETCASVGIELEATANVTVEGNTLRDLNRLDYPNGGFGITLSNVGTASITDNTVSGGSDALTAFGRRQGTDALTRSGNTLQRDGARTVAEFVQLVPVAFEFSRTVVPENGTRALAFLCYELRLVDESGGVVRAISLGSDEAGVTFGEGIDNTEQSGGETWRWFGPDENRSVLYFFDTDLADATALEVSGYPIEPDISATVQVDGTQTDAVTFRAADRQTYRVALSN